MMANKVSQNVM